MATDTRVLIITVALGYFTGILIRLATGASEFSRVVRGADARSQLIRHCVGCMSCWFRLGGLAMYVYGIHV